MKLESINISAAQPWENFKGYRGTVTFANTKGQIQIQTDDALSRRILTECAAELVEASKRVAETMTANILDAVAEQPALPAE